MAKRAVVTLHTDPSWTPLTDLTLPTHRAYADRVGADYVVLSKRSYAHRHYDKWHLEPLFDTYDRILYLDADTIVRPDTPNLFVSVPSDRLAGENELLTHDHSDGLNDFVQQMDMPALPSVPFYVNGGVFLASKCHRHIFRPPERVLAHLPWPEQHHLNVRLIGEGVPMCLLPQAFNDRHRQGDYLRNSFVLHYSVTDMEGRIAAVKRDLAAWEQMAA